METPFDHKQDNMHFLYSVDKCLVPMQFQEPKKLNIDTHTHTAYESVILEKVCWYWYCTLILPTVNLNGGFYSKGYMGSHNAWFAKLNKPYLELEISCVFTEGLNWTVWSSWPYKSYGLENVDFWDDLYYDRRKRFWEMKNMFLCYIQIYMEFNRD